MECQKITNLLDTLSDNVPRFITKKWVKVHDQWGNAEDRYKPSKQIRFKTSMVRSDLCDFSDTSFIGCILIINNTLIDNAEDLDVVMPMVQFDWIQ